MLVLGEPLMVGGLFCAGSAPKLLKRPPSSSLHPASASNNTTSTSVLATVISCIVLFLVVIPAQRVQSRCAAAWRIEGRRVGGRIGHGGDVRLRGNAVLRSGNPAIACAHCAGTGGFASPPCDGFAFGASAEVFARSSGNR